MDTDESTAARGVPEAGARDQVLVGVDGSSNANCAALWAAAEAEKPGAQLLVAHAVQLPDNPFTPLEPFEHADHRRTQDRLLLDRELERVVTCFPGLAVGTMLYDSSPAYALTSLSRESVLVVTGARGHGGFTGMLAGSVSRKFAAHTHCPLVVVESRAHEQRRDEIALGIGPETAPAALGFAFEKAHRDRLGIRGVRTWWPDTLFEGMTVPGSMSLDDPDVFREAALAHAEAAVKPFEAEFPKVNVHLEVREGNAVPEPVEAARDAELLVVGAHRRHGPLSIGAGYVVDGVLDRSTAPVAVIPESGGGTT